MNMEAGVDHDAALAKPLSPVVPPSNDGNEMPPSDDPGIGPSLLPCLPVLLRGMSTEERGTLEKRLVSKVDLRLLPAIVLMYILNHMDR